MIRNDKPTLSNTPTTDDNWVRICEEVRLFHHYRNLSYAQCDRAEKWLGFKSLGYSDQECDQMCKPKAIDMEAEVRAVSEELGRERRIWNRENQSNFMQPKRPTIINDFIAVQDKTKATTVKDDI